MYFIPKLNINGKHNYMTVYNNKTLIWVLNSIIFFVLFLYKNTIALYFLEPVSQRWPEHRKAAWLALGAGEWRESCVSVFRFRFASFSFLPYRRLNAPRVCLWYGGAWEITAGRCSGLHGPTMDRDDCPLNRLPTTRGTNAPQRPEDMVAVLSHFPVTQQGLGSSLSSMHGDPPKRLGSFCCRRRGPPEDTPFWSLSCTPARSQFTSAAVLRRQDVVEDAGRGLYRWRKDVLGACDEKQPRKATGIVRASFEVAIDCGISRKETEGPPSWSHTWFVWSPSKKSPPFLQNRILSHTPHPNPSPVSILLKGSPVTIIF